MSYQLPAWHHPLYKTWWNMLGRCERPNHPKFEHYGARGIRVCAAWHSLERFAADMGERPAGHLLDRIDNDGDYEPENCKWSTVQASNLNKRDAGTLTHCKNGHARTPENTYVNPANGKANCRQCRRDTWAVKHPKKEMR